MRKATIILLAGLALLVLPHTTSFAQECKSPVDMAELAKESGVDYKTDLTGVGLKVFFQVYFETTQSSVTPEEMEALLSQIDQVGIAGTDEVGFIVVYSKGCATKVVQVQKELLDFVMKSVEQKASNGTP